MPYQLGETVYFPVQFNHIDTGEPFTPSGTPTISIVLPNGSVNTAAASLLSGTAIYRRSLVVSSAGQYYWFGSTDDANSSRDNTDTGVIEVGQTWISRIDATISSRSTLTAADIRTVLESVEVQYVPVTNANTGDISLWKDDDYTVLSGRTLPSWTSTAWSVYDLSAAQWVKMYISNKLTHEVELGDSVALSDTEVQTRITKAQKASLSTGTNVYDFKVRAKLDVAHGEAEETLVFGKLTVLD